MLQWRPHSVTRRHGTCTASLHRSCANPSVSRTALWPRFLCVARRMVTGLSYAEPAQLHLTTACLSLARVNQSVKVKLCSLEESFRHDTRGSLIHARTRTERQITQVSCQINIFLEGRLELSSLMDYLLEHSPLDHVTTSS